MEESAFEQPTAGHATAGARRAADDNPSVWIQVPCAPLKIAKRDIETLGGVSDRKLLGRSNINDQCAGLQKPGNLALCDDLGERALNDDRRNEGHQTVLNDIRR